ncbi:decaheme c-type cytochrome, OmcA/MtrC family [Burkholderiaceae bacterium]|nr:decaheme c-type cytochrome, OmcA/MtrC family [Burkholderiaceae bacterium]
MAAGLVALAIAGCGGGSGSSTTPPDVVLPPDIETGQTALANSTALNIHINSVTIAGRPVVDFTVTNQAGSGMTGIAPADLRFNISKLQPDPEGGPANWQNYINRAVGGVVQATQERASTGYAFGTLERLGSGRYIYTFATDITDPSANTCPAPCTTAEGEPLDTRYAPALTHRVAIQQANRNYPEATGVHDFVPSGEPVTMLRDVVATSTCNSCHSELTAHGSRVDTKLCVTCHNPGTSVAGTPNTTVDFKVMIHRFHYNNAGAALPSVQAGVPYRIGRDDFSAVTFTQDVRNCTRCHDGTPGAANTAPQGDHWKTQPSMQVCGSCHDNVYFGSAPDPTKPYQTVPHSGGVMTDNGTCASCHAAGKFGDAKDIAIAHGLPSRLTAAAARFQFNILSVSGATPGGTPVVTFSVTDPTRGDAPYDIKADPAFTAAAGVSSLSLKIGWTTADFSNDGSGQRFGQPISINALSAAVQPGPTAGTYIASSPTALPAGLTGTLRVTMEGHPAGDVTTAGSFTDRLAVKNVFKDVAVTGTLLARRTVVDIAKCNMCHGTLSLHGNNRTDEIGACTVCHNSNATDAARRPTSAGVLTGGIDGKLEESIDFKTMIHGIHAGQARNEGITVYGFGGTAHDFSGVAFPGKIEDCATCHVGTSYQITGPWLAPSTNGILGTTVSTGASAIDPADNLRMSPTVAVCSSCHDNAVAKVHMQDPSSGGTFSATQSALQTSIVENCAMCHGAGRVFDVKTVHGVK